MHGFDFIALRQGVPAVPLSRDDLAVHLDGNATLIEAELRDQAVDRQPINDVLQLTIDTEAHVETIVISSCLYNLRTIW